MRSTVVNLRFEPLPVELNLPGLRKDSRVRIPARSGAWSPLAQLNDLGAALEIEAGSMKLGGIKSVPHTWGHIIVFETALLDEHHPGHQDAKGQWRGLLAMLALRNRPGFSITAHEVELRPQPGAQGDTHRFTGLAEKEQPKRRIDGNCTWDPVHLLYAEADGSPNDPGVLVGALSPSTIVAPARDFSAPGSLRQFWARHGLRDPLTDAPQSEELSPDELEVCRLFALHVRDRVRRLESRRDPDAANAIVGLLDEFAKNLQAAGAANAIATWTEKALGDLVARDPGGLYGAVNSVWVEKGKPDVTDLLLCTVDIDKKTPLKVVLADPRCVQTLGKRPQHISLFGSRTLADLPIPAQDGAPVQMPEHLREEAATNNILLLGPEDLLADRLTMLEGFRTDAHPEALTEHLLPVRAAALLLYPNIDELKESVDLLGSASRPRAGLRVTLTDRQGRAHKHLVVRDYRADAVEPANPPEALAAWPDFRFSRAAERDGAVGWKWNYLFTSTNVSREPRERAAIVTTGLSREMLYRDLARVYRDKKAAGVSRRLQEWSSAAGPWPAPSGAQREDDGRGQGGAWFEWLRMRDDAGPDPHEKNLQRGDSAFEGALFRLPTEDGSVYAGLGVLPRARDMSTQEAAAGGTAQIALDFGTSNTIVYCKRGEGTIEPLPFRTRLRRFNAQRDDDGLHVDREADYAAFMPRTDVEPPFATVMQVRNADGIDDLNRAWKDAGEPALWRDYAFFDPDVLHLTESLLSGRGRSNLIFDLKWGREADDRKRMGRYLRHIGMLALAEVVGHRDLPAPSSVEWRLSYPIAAPDSGTYREILSFAAPPAQGDDIDWSTVEFHTESHAALDYFRQAEAAQPQAMLVLDIGGGSTDIALAAREKGVWQNSVRLAGDDLMTEFLLYNRAVLEKLELAHIGKDGVFGDRRSQQAFMHPPADQRPAEKDRNAAKAIINSPVFARVFADNWIHVKDDDALRLLKAGASVMMGGLCAFMGLQIRALLRAQPPGLDARRLTSIRLCFGGRGSTLFKLLRNDPSFKRMMQYLTTDFGLDDPPEVTSYFSRDMKHEVAKGMLAQSRNRTEFPGSSGRVLGVGVRLGPKSDNEPDSPAFANTTTMDDVKDRLPDGTAREGVGAPEIVWDEFDRFLARVGRDAAFSLTVKREARDDITSDGNAAFSRIVSGQREIEPPFIAMLRKTSSLLYEGKGITVDWNPRQDW